jgi:hypothetical protein
MRSGASTPEDLESLFEDAFVIGNADAFAGLFDSGAVLSASGASDARGGEQIVRLATAMRGRGYVYLADPGRVFQAGDISVVVAERAINVMRRGSDRRWRYAISVLDIDHELEGASDGARHH